jgi:hypothetical protein
MLSESSCIVYNIIYAHRIFAIYIQTSRDVYAVGAYSCFGLIIIVFLITDYLKYKPVLIMDGICGVITYCSIVGHPSLLRMQVSYINSRNTVVMTLLEYYIIILLCCTSRIEIYTIDL